VNTIPIMMVSISRHLKLKYYLLTLMCWMFRI
jgi:hypothetical protein